MTSTWHEDILGPDWVRRTLELPDGAVATLVRPAAAVPPGAGTRRRAVLYVHGFVDYFFQAHLAPAFDAAGYTFYAVDLRGYGRSLRDTTDHPELPNYVTDLSLYAQDLDAAVQVIRAEGHDEVVLLGHSTGGLVASLWANARPEKLAALVLNSPWFDLNEPWFRRNVLAPVFGAGGRFLPRVKVGGLNPHYGQALHAQTGGEWEYDLAWKPHNGFPVRMGWLREIRRAQARVARGLDIGCPVLVLTSARSGPSKGWHDELMTTDSVLDVEQIRERAARLGDDVTIVGIEGGAHDLALSPEPARSRYLAEVTEWLARRVP